MHACVRIDMQQNVKRVDLSAHSALLTGRFGVLPHRLSPHCRRRAYVETSTPRWLRYRPTLGSRSATDSDRLREPAALDPLNGLDCLYPDRSIILSREMSSCRSFSEENIAITPEELRSIASTYLHDNQCPGDPGYCEPAQADWTLEWLTPQQMNSGFASAAEALDWLQVEIQMSDDEGLNRDWRRLLTEQIQVEIVVLIRDQQLYVWDGFHRLAAAMSRNCSIKAIAGRPRI